MPNFNKLKTEIVKIGESGLIEVSLTQMTDGQKTVDFVSIDRSYMDSLGVSKRKSQTTIPRAQAIDVANAINKVMA